MKFNRVTEERVATSFSSSSPFFNLSFRRQVNSHIPLDKEMKVQDQATRKGQVPELIFLLPLLSFRNWEIVFLKLLVMFVMSSVSILFNHIR
jgi:hypothetical protein